MSAPNKSFDPKEVSALSPESIATAVEQAIAAFAAAGSLDELKEARLAHTGDRSALALANLDAHMSGKPVITPVPECRS